MSEHDDDREVLMIDDTDIVVLPDQTRDDTDEGWGSYADERETPYERPPHYE
jgi:hypothetical protein